MSTIRAANYGDGSVSVAAGVVMHGSAKGWLTADGQAAAIIDSYNIGSMTDIGVGQYDFVFVSLMATASYATPSHAGNVSSTTIRVIDGAGQASSSVTIRTGHTGGYADAEYIAAASLGDLA